MIKVKFEFCLVRSSDGNHYWTALLPEQLKKFKTAKESEQSLARLIERFQKGKFEIVAHDLTTGQPATDYVGGTTRLLNTIKKEKKTKKK